MKIKALTLQNIRSYEDQTVEFPDGTILIRGDNGAGKTSLLMGIFGGLFLSKIRNVGTNDFNLDDLVRRGEDKGTVELVFEIDGTEFTETWELHTTGKQNSATLDCPSFSDPVTGIEDVREEVIGVLGMDEDDFSSFFDLGNSNKDDAIGYKGHGTKIYYKSDKIRVETVKDDTEIESVMSQPWTKLNNRELPTYSVEKTDSDELSQTRIEVHGFRAGQGFDPQKLTYNKIEHYIKWKSIGGSTAWYFTDDFHQMDINVELSPTIDDTRGPIETDNRLRFPPENLDPDGEFVAEKMCKHYPPQELTIVLENERELTVEVVGMVGGKEARNELPTYGKHSAQFGIWLAKDHIKVERYNDAIGADNEFFHFFFVANCQDLELSANREKIRNKSGDVYQAITDELDRFMTKVCQESWYQNYIERRKLENKKRSILSQESTLEERRQRTEEQGGLSPSNSAEVIAMLERYSANGAPETVKIADFQIDDEVNAILDTENGLENASLQVKLSDFFEDESPLSHIDRFVCWKLGDLDALSQIERSSYMDEPIRFDFQNNEVRYGDDSPKLIPVLELSKKVS